VQTKAQQWGYSGVYVKAAIQAAKAEAFNDRDFPGTRFDHHICLYPGHAVEDVINLKTNRESKCQP
jgi:hypothetical protein